MYTAICVQYRTGATTDIDGAFLDIEKSSISGYIDHDIEVLNFDIDVSSISYCVDIEVPGFDIEYSSISCCVDIEAQALDIEDSSISYWIDIECYNLQYRRFSGFLGIRYRMSKPSISNCHIVVIVPDIEGHFPTFNIEGFTFP